MNIKAIIMLMTGGALLSLFLLAKINIDAKKRLERELKSQIALVDQYQKQAELWRVALREHNTRIKSDIEKITVFEEKVKDLNAYIETLEDRNSLCLSDADTDRLRQLWSTEPTRP